MKLRKITSLILLGIVSILGISLSTFDVTPSKVEASNISYNLSLEPSSGDPTDIKLDEYNDIFLKVKGLENVMKLDIAIYFDKTNVMVKDVTRSYTSTENILNTNKDNISFSFGTSSGVNLKIKTSLFYFRFKILETSLLDTYSFRIQVNFLVDVDGYKIPYTSNSTQYRVISNEVNEVITSLKMSSYKNSSTRDEGDCKEDFKVSKELVDNLNDFDLDLFMTSTRNNIVKARNRYEAWASANGVNPYRVNTNYKLLSNNMKDIDILFILISLISISSISILIYQKTRKNPVKP